MRVVFDAVVFVRSLINPLGIWGHLVFERSHQYQLITSPELTAECIGVIARPAITKKYRPVITRDLSVILKQFEDAEVVELPSIPAVSRDRNDDHVLATAFQGQADFLVSEDNDLLVLQNYHATRIVSARTFLDILDELSET